MSKSNTWYGATQPQTPHTVVTSQNPEQENVPQPDFK
jgi:hypothetical protein